MIHELIKRELEKVKSAQLPHYNDDVTEIIIPFGETKQDAIDEEFIVGNHYQIKVEDYILHPYEGFTLHTNWNGGTIPTEEIMDVVVTQLMGKMVKVASNTWEGWLPRKSFVVLSRIE